jgi:hypothetical protein
MSVGLRPRLRLLRGSGPAAWACPQGVPSAAATGAEKKEKNMNRNVHSYAAAALAVAAGPQVVQRAGERS